MSRKIIAQTLVTAQA